MPKPTLRGRKPANRELQPELYIDRPKGRGFRPSYEEMREALNRNKRQVWISKHWPAMRRTIVARLGAPGSKLS